MREFQASLPEIVLLVGTRAALGAGLGLLLADRLPGSQRKAVGWTLFLVGAITTVPLAFEFLGKIRAAAAGDDDPRYLEADVQRAKHFDRQATAGGAR